jgi:hypothetical protein
MCNNFRETDETEVIGYKIVLRDPNKPGRYRSAMSGNLYPINKNMPNHTPRQSKHSIYYECLDIEAPYHNRFFKDEMIGRTAVFISGWAADCFYRDFMITGESEVKHLLTIVRCKLSGDLLNATYGGEAVVCGRRLEILEEIGTLI